LRERYSPYVREGLRRLPAEQDDLREHGIGVFISTMLDSSSRILEQFLMQKQNTR
jgi:hypothetical protein